MISVFTSCFKADSERFSFTLNFSISSKDSLTINDTLTLISEHADKETNYFTGEYKFVDESYFDTGYRIFELGNFGEGINCRIMTDAIKIIAEKGSCNDSLLQFVHNGDKYSFLARIIPMKAGSYAMVLKDKEEIRKVFKTNYHRDVLNEFNIFELSLSNQRIPIDERICFIKVY